MFSANPLLNILSLDVDHIVGSNRVPNYPYFFPYPSTSPDTFFPLYTPVTALLHSLTPLLHTTAPRLHTVTPPVTPCYKPLTSCYNPVTPLYYLLHYVTYPICPFKSFNLKRRYTLLHPRYTL